VADIDPDQMVRVGFSPDGSTVTVVSNSGDIDLLRSDDLSLIRTLRSATGPVEDPGLPDGFPVVAVSSDNRYVASWHWKRGVEIWNAQTGESLAALDGRRDYRPPAPGDHERFIDFGYANSDWAVAHFPTVILDFDSDGTGLSLAVIQTFDRPDGTAYSRSLDTDWSLRTDDLIDTACGIVGRDLTEQEWAQYVGEGVDYRPTCSTA